MVQNEEKQKAQTARIRALSFGSVYPLYLKKIQKKGRSSEELDEVIFWLTAYSQEALQRHLREASSFETFFNEAPCMNPLASKITGLICGYRIEEIQDDIVRKVRYLDKLVDELAKGRPMNKILRS